MKFKNMRKVFKRDWRSISRNPVAMIIVAGICILPSLYAWVNIKACWDVYENTGSIPVAVVNKDKEAEFRDEKINIGSDVVEELKENDKLDWQFVSERQAELGLADGTYFAAIELPEDFSENFTTLFSSNPVKPQIIYKVDTKQNPVAGKITESAKNTLVQEITSSFVSTVNETIFDTLNPVGEDADDNLTDVLKMKDSIVNLNRNMDTVSNLLGALHDNSNNLDQFLTSIHSSWPLVENGLNNVSKTAVSQQELSRSTQDRLNGSLNYMDTNLNYIKSSGQRTHALLAELNDAAAQGNTAKINTIFTDLDAVLGGMEDSVGATSTYLRQYRKIDWGDDAQAAAKKLDSLKTSLTSLRKQLVKMQGDLKTLSGDAAKFYAYLNQEIPKMEQLFTVIDASLTGAVQALGAINQQLNSPQIAALIQSLQALQHSGIKDSIMAALQAAQNSGSNLAAGVQAANKAIASAIQAIDEALPKITKTVDYLNDVEANDEDKKDELTNVINSLDGVQQDVDSIQKKLTDIRSQSTAAADITAGKLNTINDDLFKMEDRFTGVLTEYNKSIRGDVQIIGSHLVSAADDAVKLAQSAQKLGSEIGSMVQTAQEGAQLAADFTGTLDIRLKEFQDMIEGLGSKLELVNNDDIAQIVSILQSNPEFMGSFISEPFEQKTESIYAIPNYGSSMAPIYTTLALWVGCLIFNSLLKATPAQFEGIEELSLREKHFGKMMFFCSMAAVQGLIVSLGDIFLLKVHMVNPFLFVCMAVYSSVVFCIITYTLFSTLGNGGKALAIIYMIFQVAGSGGSYPIQVDPLLFRVLQPLFPFTYTVGGFREAIAGPLVSAVMLDFAVLTLFAVVFFIAGYFLINRLYPKVHRFEEMFEKSGLSE